LADVLCWAWIIETTAIERVGDGEPLQKSRGFQLWLSNYAEEIRRFSAAQPSVSASIVCPS